MKTKTVTALQMTCWRGNIYLLPPLSALLLFMSSLTSDPTPATLPGYNSTSH